MARWFPYIWQQDTPGFQLFMRRFQGKV